MNYTRPENTEYEDKPEEWLNSALIFARSISLLLEEGMGIVTEIKGDMYNPMGESNKVIVFRKNDKIFIDDFDQDLPEGSYCKIFAPEEN